MSGTVLCHFINFLRAHPGENDVMYTRCNNLLWFKNLSQEFQLIKTMEAFREIFNRRSQIESGDKTLRVDEEEYVVSRYNGSSMKE